MTRIQHPSNIHFMSSLFNIPEMLEYFSQSIRNMLNSTNKEIGS